MHDLNAVIKTAGFKGIETTEKYRKDFNYKGSEWSKEVDKKRSEYHSDAAKKTPLF